MLKKMVLFFCCLFTQKFVISAVNFTQYQYGCSEIGLSAYCRLTHKSPLKFYAQEQKIRKLFEFKPMLALKWVKHVSFCLPEGHAEKFENYDSEDALDTLREKKLKNINIQSDYTIDYYLSKIKKINNDFEQEKKRIDGLVPPSEKITAPGVFLAKIGRVEFLKNY